ncbi:squalene synthase HpnC [Nocardioides sp. CER19]|uniref:squalene synthase HpnC n=1 Tax=Nocardioides sp. CER19 TaxID=3038538 RepID=UPI002447E8AB|nr:squalene synthase HpnC [Nocardioides sp. CER19]MDH2414477.1 squalene synthase HpnC [Nocardioides sp. CER19]
MAAGGAVGDVDVRAGEENFPVALRVLPARHRRHLVAVYGYARMVDELGDSYAGDRVAALERVRTQVDDLWAGRTVDDPVLRRLAATVVECGLGREPFVDLIEANLLDQRVVAYASFEDLLGYCRLSANPVGRIVLEVFGQSTPARVALSDDVCTGLQLLEHWQDVGEDRRAGRVYLPEHDMAAYGVSAADLDAPVASPALRELLLVETERAAALLGSGDPLVRQLRGWARLAVAGFVAGGEATAAALRRSGGDVLSVTPRPRKAETLARLLRGVVWQPPGGAR